METQTRPSPRNMPSDAPEPAPVRWHPRGAGVRPTAIAGQQREDPMQLLDVVALVSSRPADGLRVGTVGTIVDVHEGSPAAYEVEFTDDDGSTVALLTLGPAEIRPWRG